MQLRPGHSNIQQPIVYPDRAVLDQEAGVMSRSVFEHGADTEIGLSSQCRAGKARAGPPAAVTAHHPTASIDVVQQVISHLIVGAIAEDRKNQAPRGRQRIHHHVRVIPPGHHRQVSPQYQRGAGLPAHQVCVLQRCEKQKYGHQPREEGPEEPDQSGYFLGRKGKFKSGQEAVEAHTQEKDAKGSVLAATDGPTEERESRGHEHRCHESPSRPGEQQQHSHPITVGQRASRQVKRC